MNKYEFIVLLKTSLSRFISNFPSISNLSLLESDIKTWEFYQTRILCVQIKHLLYILTSKIYKKRKAKEKN